MATLADVLQGRNVSVQVAGAASSNPIMNNNSPVVVSGQVVQVLEGSPQCIVIEIRPGVLDVVPMTAPFHVRTL